MRPPHTTISTSKTANVHIDWISFLAPLTHIPTGKPVHFEDETLGLVPMAATRNQQILRDGGKTAQVRSKEINPRTGMAAMIEVQCCPPKVLQQHNLFGHANLGSYVYEIMDLLTKRLGIKVDRFEREEWRRGGVGITEIHLTANFGCPRSDVLPIIQAIDENNSSGKGRPIETSISLGYTPTRRSTVQVVTVYDKKLELENQWKKPGPYQSKLINEAAKGIRAEVKLYSQGLRHRGLHFVLHWKDVDVAALYFEILAKKRLKYSIQRQLTEHEMSVLSNAERKAYLLWLNGMPIAEQFSRTTAWKHAKSILEKTGIDVKGDRRPERLPTIDLTSIFVPENILPVPDWAKGTEYYCAPKRRPGVMGIPVPPDAVDEVIMLDGEPYLI